MKILLSGYLPAEGRYSMLRTAHALYKHLPVVLGAGDTVALDEAAAGEQSAVLTTSGLRLKLEKRLKTPLRLRRAPCDCLHLVDSDYCFGLSRSLLARTVVTCHDMMPFLVYDSLEEAFPKPLGRYFFGRILRNLPHAARIVTDSAFSKTSILRFTACREEQISVIPLGVDAHFRPLPHFPAAAEAFFQQHDLEGKRLLLHVGATERYKNMAQVLAITAGLQGLSGAPVYLLKMGGQFDAALQEKMVALGLAERVIHLTGLSEEALCWVYNKADLLVQPSYFEGFGWPVLEAMACGLPVVSSTGGSLPEVAGTAAPVHDPDDTEAFVASARALIEDTAYRAAAIAAGRAQAARFGWTQVAQRYYEVYRGLGETWRG